MARIIGSKTMQGYLNKLHCGNAKISKIGTFWLDHLVELTTKDQTILIFNVL
ncbi:hypothetical protein UXU46_08430 [Campylobacter jejuni]